MTFTITVNNVQSRLSGYTAELESKLTVVYENFQYSPRYKQGLWDGKFHFLKVPSLKFPTGLLPIVTRQLEDEKIEYHIIDERITPSYKKTDITDNMLSGITLRDYQMDAIRASVEAQRGVLELPTGSGKTEVAAGIIKHLGLRTLFLIHTQDLLHQTAKRFEARLESEIGLIGDGEFNSDPSIVVATVQSLASLYNRKPEEFKAFINSFPVIFQDEAHHASAATWYMVGMHAHGAYYRYGLSGTVLRKDLLSNMKMLAVFGAPIQRIRSEDLIKQGYLSEIKVIMIANNERVAGYSWADVYRNGVVRSYARNSLIANIAAREHRAGNKVLILIRIIEHGKALAETLEALGVKTLFLSGKDDSETREIGKDEFNKEGDFVLIASPIFSEGVDIPQINVLIVAVGGKSEVQTIQRVGRGLRPKADGSALTVYDFMDSAKWLRSHSEERLAVYEEQGFPCVKYSDKEKYHE